MQNPPDPASVYSATKTRDETNARRCDEVAYQLMTVGAILLVLGSLWVF